MICFHHSVQEVQQSKTSIELRVYNLMQTLLMLEVTEKKQFAVLPQPPQPDLVVSDSVLQ